MAAMGKSSRAKWVIVPRVLAGAPLLLFGIIHLLGAEKLMGSPPIRALIDASGMPAPGVMEYVGPLLQAVGGLLLLVGAFTRLGAVLAIGSMAGAIYTHIQIPNDQWPMPTDADPNAVGAEPVQMMYVAIGFIVLSLVMLVMGGGRWSVDARMAPVGAKGMEPRATESETPQI